MGGPFQYEFRKHYTTEHALLDTVGKIQKYVDEKLFSCGIFIDLRKASDTVDHNILLNKLHHYRIRGIINKWFCSYLVGRFQATQIETKISKKEAVACQCGVPLGSVLGQLLFLLYINDISASSSKFEFFLFADDTNKDKSFIIRIGCQSKANQCL